MPRSKLRSVIRFVGLVGLASTFIGGTAVFALNQVQTHTEAKAAAVRPVATRPSYLAPLPRLTAKDFDVARGTAATVTGKREPATLSEPKQEAKSISVGSISTVTPPADDAFDSHSATALNVRSGPNKNTAKVFVLRAGTPVRIDQSQGGWVKITTVDGATGWVYSSYLSGAQDLVAERDEPKGATSESPETRPSPRDAKAFRLANDTVMRSSPSRSSKKLSVIEGGSKLLVAEWDGAWARVILADGTSGWIKSQ